MNRRTATRSSGSFAIRSDTRRKSKDEAEKGMWSSMLDSVASGRKLPEKNLIVLGGTPGMQKEFLETLNSDAPKRQQDRHRKNAHVANDFALGYTYQDVLDADHEDILARLSIYLLAQPSPSFAPLLSSRLTPQSIPESLLVILLDWNEPWLWIRQLRDRIILFRSITASLSDEAKETLEETMKDWQEKRRGLSSYDNSMQVAGSEANVALPLSQGEWDEPLGLPLCIVCHNSEKINSLESEQRWREEDFDFVLQFLRTILMKHGASLIYTSNSAPNSLPTLIHSSLGIHSMLKKQALKHNVIDRDKVLVPPNWDSWGKIRVLREGFDVKGVSSKWSDDISRPLTSEAKRPEDPTRPTEDSEYDDEQPTALSMYESNIYDPDGDKRSAEDQKPRVEVSVPSMQAFLATQQETLVRLLAEDERSSTPSTTQATTSTHERVSDQIGPVQVNMGGIQVDADDVVRKLQHQTKRDRSARRDGEGEGEGTPRSKKEGANMSTPEMKAQNEDLQKFFKNLMNRGASNSPRGTPSKSTPKEGAK
ncbi:MAG: hypothetical protein OHK93_003504 [Ramalina farinacea]|uniref:Dynein light intermediate chain n=1 Tax=Ramalina farinacea TaxID=258253 RepID=A0AA43QU46_9LECA|nr:hypothetical protein [Ramalina farinacea]